MQPTASHSRTGCQRLSKKRHRISLSKTPQPPLKRQRIRKVRLNLDQAGRLLTRMLVGGVLGEMRVNGPAITLVFQNDNLAHGFLADVDFAFACRAAVCLAPCEGTFPKEEFHTSRSLFLAEMYKLN